MKTIRTIANKIAGDIQSGSVTIHQDQDITLANFIHKKTTNVAKGNPDIVYVLFSIIILSYLKRYPQPLREFLFLF